MSEHPQGRSSPYAERMVETLHEPLLVLDDELRVREANPSFYRMFAMTPAETLGTPLSELADGTWDMPDLSDRLEAVLDRDEAFEGFEVDRVFPGVGRRVMRLNGRTLVREDGASRLVMLAIHDVTEQRELEEELRRHARELERSNTDLEQFAYAASHDLQEPLRMVASYLELLERRYADELDDEAREFIDYAVDGARRMKGLINGLLAYSRVGRKEGAFEEIALEGLLDGVRDDLGPKFGERGAELQAGALPAVYGERDQVRRVLQNLIENALTYHGDAPPRIRVSGKRRPDGMVEVAVSDRGPGIPSDQQEGIFQIFRQLDPHGTGREGSGMGLAICRKIVERHGGRIGVESDPGEGATFRFTLPADEEHAP